MEKILNPSILNFINHVMEEQGLPPLKQKTTMTEGGEWFGPCPRCKKLTGDGGRDRFRVYANAKDRPVESFPGSLPCFVCRQCKRAGTQQDWSGDLIQFLDDMTELSYTQIRTMLHLPPKAWIPRESIDINSHRGDEIYSAPNEVWQLQGYLLVESCVEALWHVPERLEYLHKRGFTNEIIAQACFGYNAEDRWEDGALWGLENTQRVFISAGYVIPEWHTNLETGEQELWAISIRRFDVDVEIDYLETGNTDKYRVVTGSIKGLYNSDSLFALDKPCILVEGQFDAWSVIQVVGDQFAVVASQSKQGSHAHQFKVMLAVYTPLIYVIVDADQTEDTVANYWVDTFPEKTIVLHPDGHDANDMLVKGVLDSWLQKQFRKPTEPLIEPSNIITTPKVENVPTVTTEPNNTVSTEETILIATRKSCVECEQEGLFMDMQGMYWCRTHFPGDEGMVISTLAELEKFMVRELYDEQQYRVMDLETTGLKFLRHKVISITFDTPLGVVIIDARKYYSASQEEQVQWRALLQRLFSIDTVWCGHNIKFDMNFMAYHFGVEMPNVYDTMLVERLIHAGETTSVSMFESAKRYGIAVSKEERSWFIDLDKRKGEWEAPFPFAQRIYMVQDIQVPIRIMLDQYEKITQYQLQEVVDIEHKVLPAISAMEVTGVFVDRAVWKTVLAQAKQDHVRLEQELQAILGKAIDDSRSHTQLGLFDDIPATVVNLSSGPQMIHALGLLGITVTSMAKGELEQLAHEHPIIEKILEWKKVEKFINSFGESLLEHIETDGRIHSSFTQIVSTGRMSCSSPNLQQIPKGGEESYDIRQCFVAPKGSTLLIADLPNIELRILADLSGDEYMLDCFARELDLHSETARMMFRLGQDTDPKKIYINGVEARFAAKSLNFGLAYGMGPQGLARRINTDTTTARKMMDDYFAMYKGVAKYLQQSGRKGVAQRYAATLSGRRRNFYHIDMGDGAKRAEVDRASKNHPIQGLNADIIKVALANLHVQLPKEAKVVLVVHDEIVVECPETMVDAAKSILARCMEQACKRYLKRVFIPPQKVAVSDHWTKD